MRVSSPTLDAVGKASHLRRHGQTLHPPGLAGPSCGPSHAPGVPAPPPGVPDVAAGPSRSRPRPTRCPSSHPCQRLTTALRPAWPVHAPWPGRRAHDTAPSPGRTDTAWASLTAAARARRQSRRRARRCCSSNERRRTTTPRSPRAPRGTVGSSAAELRQKRGRLARCWQVLGEGSAVLWRSCG